MINKQLLSNTAAEWDVLFCCEEVAQQAVLIKLRL